MQASSMFFDCMRRIGGQALAAARRAFRWRVAPIDVLPANEHVVFREALRALLERGGMNVVGEAADGEDAVRLAKRLHPRVAVMDAGMSGMNGIDAAREIRQVSSGTRTILLAGWHDHIQPLHAGVRGYVSKNNAYKGLIPAIERVNAAGRC
jgi:DNA-binding NarL/FixJ family response regulator